MKQTLLLFLALCFCTCKNKHDKTSYSTTSETKPPYDKTLPVCQTQKEFEAQFRKKVYVVGKLYIPGPKIRRSWISVTLKDSSDVLLAFFKTGLKKHLNGRKVRIKGLACSQKDTLLGNPRTY